MKITRLFFENTPFRRKTGIFSLEIPHLSENHVFSFRKTPHLIEYQPFYL
ncbi:hypothetical protein CP10743SC13_1769 [Chlamydia psittaci 10_743_SC13]|nr:hypothetical protein CP10743SC13_1769 [Chlamydia psittaci 10_743_SC13]